MGFHTIWHSHIHAVKGQPAEHDEFWASRNSGSGPGVQLRPPYELSQPHFTGLKRVRVSGGYEKLHEEGYEKFMEGT